MGLVDLASVASLLSCPRCGCGLVEAQSSFMCSSPSCDLHARGSFPTVGHWPVLVDFERSIVDEREVRSASNAGSVRSPGTRRWSIDRLPAWLRPCWNPPNRVAARNVELLLSLLPGPSLVVLVIGGGTMGNGVEAL
jgi:hypothetical protein